MAKTTEFSRLLAVVILVLLVLGTGCYFLPRFAQVINGETVEWSVASEEDALVLSSFEEQSFLQQAYADDIRRDIIDSLERVVGQGAVQASVRVQLDLEKEQSSKTKMYKETYSEDVTYRTAGVVKGISVSVLVDGETERNKSGRSVYQPRTKDEMKKFETIVKGVIGYQATRGDKVEILNMPFEEHQISFWGMSGQAWANGALLLFFFLFVAGLIIPFIKNLTYVPKASHPKKDLLKKAVFLCRQDIQRAVSIFKNALKQSQVRKNPRVYTPVEQAAIVLLCLGDSLLKDIFSYLSEEEIRSYGKIMAKLGRVSASDIRQALAKFIRQFYTPSLLFGSPERVKEVLTATRSDGKNLYSEIYLTASGKDIWHCLADLDKGMLISFLKEQKPETIALVLYHLPEKLSGQMLTLLPKDLIPRILIHLTHMVHVRSDVREKLTGEIATALYRLLKEGKQADKTADILKTLNKKERDVFVSDLAQKDGQTAYVMASCFKDWSDVLTLSEDKLKRLLKYIDKKVLALALADKNESEQTVFARLLPPALWQQVVDLIQRNLGQNGQKARDVILKTARELGLF